MDLAGYCRELAMQAKGAASVLARAGTRKKTPGSAIRKRFRTTQPMRSCSANDRDMEAAAARFTWPIWIASG